MQQSEDFIVPGKENLECKQKKCLYGLKQAPREWYQKFDTFIKYQLYTKKLLDGSLLILILYVDDMLIFGKNIHDVDALR